MAHRAVTDRAPARERAQIGMSLGSTPSAGSVVMPHGAAAKPHGAARSHGSTPHGTLGTPRLGRALSRIAGTRVLVLNWRDVRHPQAGGAEMYIHETARRWAAAGATVTMLTARPKGAAAREQIDGIDVRRAGGELTVYLRTALRLLRWGRRHDMVLDGQNGIPFFAPLFTRVRLPVVQLVHHVHQDQFATRFPPALAAVGRLLEGRIARAVYGRHRSVAVSTSTRHEMRKRLGFRGIIDVVPNGCSALGRATTSVRRPARAADPTVVVVSRLVPHKRIDVLLHATAAARTAVPRLQVEIIGGGPLLDELRGRATRLGLDDTVRFHGRVPDAVRDALLGSAWLTTCTSDGEGWGCAVLEAATIGVPCLALRVPGVRDSVIDGRTGWLVDGVERFSAMLVDALTELAEPERATAFRTACREWAACFDWDRSAELLAASLLAESARQAASIPGRRRRGGPQPRSDTTTVARFTHPDPRVVLDRLRLTDELVVRGTTITAVLRGCDDLDAVTLLGGLGATELRVRPASRHEILGGPAAVQDWDIDRPANAVRIPAQREAG